MLCTRKLYMNALPWGDALSLHGRDGKTAQERAETLIALCHEQGFTLWLTIGTLAQGCALAQQGHADKAIPQIYQGVAALQSSGMILYVALFLALLAEAYGKIGQQEKGLAVVEQALAAISVTGERFYEVELHRLKGELTLQKEVEGWRLETSPSSLQAPSLKPQVSREVEQEAEGYFLKAINIAHQQQAKSLELRATVSLTRLWQQQGKKGKARQLLAEIYNWFTEGFDTVDLREAKGLLDELSSS